MKLRQILYECREILRNLKAYVDSRRNDTPLLSVTVTQLQNIETPQTTPSQRDLQQVNRKFKQAVKSGNWRKLNEKDWRRAPWLLWHGRKNDCLATQSAFLQRLWQQLDSNPLLAKRLVRVYLRDFDPSHPNIAQVAQYLARKIQQAPFDSPLYRWRQAQLEYQLFHPELRVEALAMQCLSGDGAAEALFQRLSLVGELVNGGYAQAIYCAMLQQVERELNTLPSPTLLKFSGLHDGRTWVDMPYTDEVVATPATNIAEWHLQQLLVWSAEGRRLRFSTQRRELIHALLRPWLHHSPPPAIREAIHVFLLHHLDDPRVNAGQWQGVQKSVLNLFYRWMVGATLETFFSLLDQFALDKHWKYRRAFWWAYYEHQHIDEAWLALGKSIQQFLHKKPLLARSVKDAYGNLSGKGVKGRQAVLLFRIKNLIVAEWSHSGKCHIWLSDNEAAPKLYETGYTRDHVTLESERIKPERKQTGVSHYGNETGSWQGDVAEFIKTHTQVSLLPEDYMP